MKRADSSVPRFAIDFEDLSCDEGDRFPQSDAEWDLWVEGTVSVKVDGAPIYEETMFSVIEFAFALSLWCEQLGSATTPLTFEPTGYPTYALTASPHSDCWLVDSPYRPAHVPPASPVAAADIAFGVAAYVGRLHEAVHDRFGYDLNQRLHA